MMARSPPFSFVRPLVAILLCIIGTCESEEAVPPLTRFAPGGKLPQNEAASRAVDRGGLVLGLTGEDCVVLVAPW